VGGLVGLVAVLVIVWGRVSYNRLVRQRSQVDAVRAQTDVQLRRRYDLVPNLVETVKGYAGYGRGTLNTVMRAGVGGFRGRDLFPAVEGSGAW
jgi:LemA protein